MSKQHLAKNLKMTSQKQSQLTNEILQGNLIKLIFKLSTPAILGMLLITGV
ncbi:hypothetical protein H6G81_23070 [Scytonema hofmannii FACHB-248]|uniref:Uncharacterized protein n=1 Tax=Scytonema hofmannii FACHB-248 TaxID=1842502 RepID=A0ABR8GX58_9CYAN|nr:MULTISPECIES: hypothetical protein [Nostocales]MBD2607333.1 hypothetical protein [Scytonema hofmannii FACHB-248]